MYIQCGIRSLCGVLDGHSGPAVAEYAAKRLPEIFQSQSWFFFLGFHRQSIFFPLRVWTLEDIGNFAIFLGFCNVYGELFCFGPVWC